MRVQQNRIAPRNAFVGTVHNVASLRGDSIEVEWEHKQPFAFVKSEERGPGVGELVVKFDDRHIVVARPLAGKSEILHPWLSCVGCGAVRGWPVGHHLLRDRILPGGGNNVSGERCSGRRAIHCCHREWIVNSLGHFGKITSAHLGGRHGKNVVLTIAFARALIGSKPKSAIPAVVQFWDPNRPT